jgi:hypothetical protein
LPLRVVVDFLRKASALARRDPAARYVFDNDRPSVWAALNIQSITGATDAARLGPFTVDVDPAAADRFSSQGAVIEEAGRPEPLASRILRFMPVSCFKVHRVG